MTLGTLYVLGCPITIYSLAWARTHVIGDLPVMFIKHYINSAIFTGRNVSSEISTSTLKLCAEDLEPRIIKHMSQNMGYRLSEIIRLITSNIPHGATATYHLLLRKLKKKCHELRSSSRISASLEHISAHLVSTVIMSSLKL